MYYAVDSDHNRVSAENAVKGTRYFCSTCGSEVIAKTRALQRVAHFAHKNAADCDSWKHEMTEWHRAWQEQFPLENQEVDVRTEDDIHRADVLVGNTVVEFQHSPMTVTEFWERNNFYNKCGYQVIWLFDVTDDVRSGDLMLSQAVHFSDSDDVRWRYGRQTFKKFSSEENLGRVEVFLQLRDDETENTDIRKVILRMDGEVRLSNHTPLTRSGFVQYCTETVTDPDMLPLEGRVILAQEKYTVGDLQDYIRERRDSAGECPKENKYVHFTYCHGCDHSEYVLQGNKFEKQIAEELRKKAEPWASNYRRGYRMPCAYRFRDILRKWNIYRDRVLSVERLDGIVTKAVVEMNGKTETITFGITEEQMPQTQATAAATPANTTDQQYQTLRKLLHDTDAQIIFAYNPVLDLSAKVSKWMDGASSIQGYIKEPGYKQYTKYRKTIPHSDLPEWVLTSIMKDNMLHSC